MAIYGNSEETICHLDNGNLVVIDNETREVIGEY